LAPPFATIPARAVAYVIDVFVLAVPAGVISQSYVDSTENSGYPLLLGLCLLAASVAYFVIGEGSMLGATPGKWLVGLRVADSETGRPIGFRRALIRTLFRVVSAVPLYAGFIVAVSDHRHQTWHDRAARSIVVTRPRTPSAHGR
jgi:uncharacterized RDD family membrane protein YckC